MTTKENAIEQKLIEKLQDLKYTYRPDIRHNAALEHNFQQRIKDHKYSNVGTYTASNDEEILTNGSHP